MCETLFKIILHYQKVLKSIKIEICNNFEAGGMDPDYPAQGGNYFEKKLSQLSLDFIEFQMDFSRFQSDEGFHFSRNSIGFQWDLNTLNLLKIDTHSQ